MELDFQLTSGKICSADHVFEVLMFFPANVLFLLLTDYIILLVQFLNLDMFL